MTPSLLAARRVGAVALALGLTGPAPVAALTAWHLGVPHTPLTVPGYNDSFGLAVDIDGDTAVILAPNYTEMERRGAAFISTRGDAGWSAPAKLVFESPTLGRDFAQSVALSGDTLVLGAWSSTGEPGNAQVFIRVGSQWVHQAELTAANATNGFGGSVAVAGDEIFVGDGLADVVTTYRRNNGVWTQVQQLSPSIPLIGSGYGASVAVEGNLLAVGRPYTWAPEPRKGSVYVYQRADAASPWLEATRFDMLDGGRFPELGYPVRISGGRIAAGAANYQIADNSLFDRKIGAVVVLEESGGSWTQQLLLPSNPAGTSLFGIGLAIDGDQLLVGAMSALGGRVYSFVRGTGQWVEAQQLHKETETKFGWSLAVSGTDVVVGAPRWQNYGSEAHIYSIADVQVPDIGIAVTQQRVQACADGQSTVGVSWASDAMYCGARDESATLTSSWVSTASCGGLPSSCPDPRDFRKLPASGQAWVTLNAPMDGGYDVGSALTVECTDAAGRSARAVTPLVTFLGSANNCPTPAYALSPTLSQQPIALANGTFEMRATLSNPQSANLHAIARHGTWGTTHARVEGSELILVYAPDPEAVGGNPLVQDVIGAQITDGNFATGQAYAISVNIGLFKNGFE